MTNWSQIRECYVQGGITHSELAEKFDVALPTLRRKAATEGWTRLRSERAGCSAKGDASAAKTRMEKQLELTDSLLEKLLETAKSGSELYYYIDERRSGDGSYEFLADKLPVLNEERLLKLVKAAGELFLLQRMALGLPDIKDELAERKLEQEKAIASRKLDLELLKIDGPAERESDDGFLAALGLSGNELSA